MTDAAADDATVDDPDGGNRGTDDRKEGTFLVTAAEADSAVFRDVADGQVHPLSSNPGVAVDEIVEGSIAPDPPLNVTWQVVDVVERREIAIRESDEPPTARTRDVAADQAVGELTRQERAGEGEWHVITVPEADTAEAVRDVLADEESLRERAARLGVSRVEVRSDPGIVSVRYLP